MNIKDNINLILGNHGSGKSTFIYNLFLKNCQNEDGTLDLSKRFYLVVPEQDTQNKQDTLIKLSTAHHQGIINIDVISFDRLCYMVCSELNHNFDKEKVVDDDIKRLILKKALQNLENDGIDFIYFKNMKDKVGFTDKLKSAMSEFYSYGINKDVIDDIVAKATNDKFKNKMSELSLIQEEFKRLLKEKDLSIMEDKLNLLNNIIDKSKICENATFAFDGFTGFTPIQKSIFSKICDKASDVYVSIDIRDISIKNIVDDFGYKNNNSPDEMDVFYLSELFINQIYDIASDQKKSIKEKNIINLCKNNSKAYDKKIAKHKDRLDLSYLEENIYKKKVKSYAGEVENISIHQNVDIESEVGFLINKIYDLLNEGKYRLNDIKVVVPHIDEYSDMLIKKCEKKNICLYVDNKKLIINSPLIEALRSVFDVVLYNFNYDSVMRYLNCGLFNKNQDNSIYLFDNAIRKYGIKGYKKYQDLLEKKRVNIVNKKDKFKYFDNIEVHIDDIINIKESILKPVFNLYEDLSMLKKDFTICEYIEKIEKYIENSSLYEKLNTVLSGFNDENDIDYILLKDNERLIVDILNKFKLLFNDDKQKIDFTAFKDLFDVCVEDKNISITPFSVEKLECGDLMRSRFDNPKVLFFLGLNESRIPSKSKDNNIIDDSMRTYLKKLSNITLSQTTKETALNQRFYVYLLMSTPVDKLYLSYTTKNSESILDYPSSIITNVCKLMNIDDKAIYKEKPYNQSDDLCDKEVVYKDFDTYTNINKNLMNDIIGNSYNASVTKLENYAKCPYKYFLEYTINLSERKKYEIDSRDIGTTFHTILEEIFDLPDFNIETMNIKDINVLIKNSIEKIKLNNDKFSDSNYAAFLMDKVFDIVSYSIERLKENIVENNPTHIASEEKLSYDIKDTSDKLSGKIDSIDNFVKDNSNFIRIVDYKSSGKTYNEDELLSGVNIQYVVYLQYALNSLKTICESHKIPYDESYMTRPLGTFYYQIHDDIKVLKKGEDLNEKINETKDKYKYNGIINKDAIEYIDKNMEIGRTGKPKSKIVDGVLLDETEIKLIIDKVNDNIKKNINEIKDGNIDVKPYKNETTCQYCPYEVVCKKSLRMKNTSDDENNE